MKNIAIIPIEATNEDDLRLPIGDIGGTTLLEEVYRRARAVKLIDAVLVTSNSKVIGRFCSVKGIPFFPSSQECPTGTHRCAEVAARFRPDANVGGILCWPLSYPLVESLDVEEMIAKYKDGVITLVKSVNESDREEFNNDRTIVKARVYATSCADFSRCPLPMSLYHIGLYYYSAAELQRVANISPTKLSKAEGLEQLSWMQYGVKITASTYRTTYYTKENPFVAIRDVHQLHVLNPTES